MRWMTRIAFSTRGVDFLKTLRIDYITDFAILFMIICVIL